MDKVILLRCGELMLKGLNRPFFEMALVKNIKAAVKGLGASKVIKSQGRIFIEPMSEDFNFDKALILSTRIFGIVSSSPVLKIESEIERIKEESIKMAKDLTARFGYKSFKVETKRADKNFSMKSPEINSYIGEMILNNIPELKVDVIKPDFMIYIEVRDSTYIYSEILPGAGGLPVGTNGRAVLLISGGIDSPVAGWMMSKRGVSLDAVHFHSYPYTSDRSKEKVIELTSLITEYCGSINLHIVPFADIQMQINEKCPHDEGTIIMRRFMMKIAERISVKTGCLALITGESMGQVASQTIQSLSVTNEVVDQPVFRPLIGMDKNDVVTIARKIGTYETSILPYEDCCTVFVAKHPKTKPVLEDIVASEQALDAEGLISDAVEKTETVLIKPSYSKY
ncbi:MAG: tRNA 4-thiouridine(8) synthase ThiI [Eubacteriales bacterium]|nr:tRNA 4-thiouridine(8) synthase ThiI [Eubacteriales bacterium]